MSKQSYAAPAVAVASILGGGLYLFSGRSPSQPIDQESKKRQQSDARRDLTGGGTGVGGNAQVMGPEVGAGVKSDNTDNPKRDRPKPGTSRENLPSGGVAGGYGGNNSNTASIEMGSQGSGGKGLLSSIFGKSDATPASQGSGDHSKSGSPTARSKAHESKPLSESLQGAAGTGGAKSRDRGDSEKDPKNTKIKSHMADSDTNRGGSPFDKHRKDVTAVTPTSERTRTHKSEPAH